MSSEDTIYDNLRKFSFYSVLCSLCLPPSLRHISGSPGWPQIPISSVWFSRAQGSQVNATVLGFISFILMQSLDQGYAWMHNMENRQIPGHLETYGLVYSWPLKRNAKSNLRVIFNLLQKVIETLHIWYGTVWYSNLCLYRCTKTLSAGFMDDNKKSIQGYVH